MGFAMAHYSMGFAMEHSKENCHCVCNQPGFFFCIASNCCQVLVSEAVKMSFQELLSTRATKLSGKSNNQEQEELRREDEGE